MTSSSPTLEVLVSTMEQHDDSILSRMNIGSDVIVCNQKCENVSLRRYIKNGYSISWYDYTDKGLSVNRNYSILLSTADICVIADDDVSYLKGYKDIIIKVFNEHPDADIILFNIAPENNGRYNTKKNIKVTMKNFGKFCSVRMAFRRKSILKANVWFNTLLGAGSIFFSGEDLGFLKDCLKKKLNIIAVPVPILKLDTNCESSWFRGYNSELFQVMGATYYYYFRNLAYFISAIQLIRKRKIFLTETKYLIAYKSILSGINKFKSYR